jgi:hypothetical protein
VPPPQPLRIVYLNGIALAEGSEFTLDGSRIQFPFSVKVGDQVMVPVVVDSEVRAYTRTIEVQVLANEWIDLWDEDPPEGTRASSRFDLIG